MYRLRCISSRATVVCLIESKDETLKRINSACEHQWDYLQLDTISVDGKKSYITISADVIKHGTFELEDLTEEGKADDRMVRCDGCHKAIRASQTEMDTKTGACFCPSCQKDSEAGYLAKLEELRSVVTKYLDCRSASNLLKKQSNKEVESREEAYLKLIHFVRNLNDAYPLKEEE